MKQIIVLISICLYAFSAVAISSRTNLQLGEAEWKVSENGLTSPLFNSTQQLSFDTLSGSMLLITEIEIDENNFKLAVLNLNEYSKYFSVFINGESLENELNEENFHAEITSFLETGKLTLQLKPIKNISVEKFKEIIDSSKIILFNGLVICHLKVMEDAFLGNKLLDVTLNNLLDKNVDGKIYARLYSVENQRLITENNNCAFARAGSSFDIEINFPEPDIDIEGKKLLAEIVFVDKENNEEIIDQFTIPVQF